MTAHHPTTESGAKRDRDRETIALLHAGHADGLRHLLEDHGGLVRSRLRKNFGMVLDDLELDEVMSLASIRIWQAAARFDATRGTLRAWLSVIARNCTLRVLELRRRSILELHPDFDSSSPEPTDSATPTSERQRLITDVIRCLHQLPTLQRAVLRADLDAGDPVPAAILAQQLSTTTSSIYVSRLKGRRALKEALQALGHFPPTETRLPPTPLPDLRVEHA